jgi:glycosyltransferase involved in cell wall biosynthesis
MRHRIRHWNLHYLLELPSEYARVVSKRCAGGGYDVIQLSQPHAWLAAREHRRRRRHGIFVNRSHGLESMADTQMLRWRTQIGLPGARFPRSLFTPLLRSRLHRHVDLVARHADGVLVPASDIREHLVAHHGADPQRVRVVHHGVPDSFLRATQAAMDDARLHRLLYVGQYSPIKAPSLLASGATLVLREEPRATFTWVCSRAHHAAVLAFFPPELAHRVRMLDWGDQEQLLALYDSHGIHMAHSVYEGAAKTATEAMSRGQVLVSSAVGALKDLVRHGENGYLVPVGDVESMAACALEAMRAPEKARDVGAAAARTAATLSWKDCAEQSLAFYRFLETRR